MEMYIVKHVYFASEFVIFVWMGCCVYVQSKMAPRIFVSVVLRASVRNITDFKWKMCARNPCRACHIPYTF